MCFKIKALRTRNKYVSKKHFILLIENQSNFREISS